MSNRWQQRDSNKLIQIETKMKTNKVELFKILHAGYETKEL